MKLTDLLREQDLFTHFNDDQIALLGSCLARVRLPRAARVLAEGDDSREAYFVVDGGVRLFRDTPYGPCTFARLTPGRFFGEESFVDQGPRSCHAETNAVTDLLSFNPVALSVVQEKDPRFGVALYWTFWRSLAERLRTSNQELLRFFEASQDAPDAPTIDSQRTPTGEFRLALSEKREVFQEQKLSSMEIHFLTSLSIEKRLPSGEVIFQEGDLGDRMYVVLEGQVRISKQIPGIGEEALAILERGDYFGEMALIDSLPRSADARAHTGGAVVLMIPRDVTTAILDPRRQTSLRLLQILCTTLAQRLRGVDDKIASWHMLTGPPPPLG